MPMWMPLRSPGPDSSQGWLPGTRAPAGAQGRDPDDLPQVSQRLLRAIPIALLLSIVFFWIPLGALLWLLL